MTKKLVWLLIAVLNMSIAWGQNTLKVVVKDAESKERLTGVTAQVKGTSSGGITDASGLLTINSVPDGPQTIVFTYVGYEKLEKEVVFPLAASEVIEVLMSNSGEELEEVIVQSTRTSRSIENVPTRVETIELEEIDEKSNMRPANVSMLLHESTGIQVQQTSATTGNASIRIQGLDGRYTQLLKDGYPTFGNFASGLSILEIPPLDLKQVEIIKGPASTLYGGGAIAGVVNFISKDPKEKGEFSLLFNQSHIGQSNVGLFTAKRKGKLGFTLLGLVNYQLPYDVDKDDFTELPASTDFTIHPRLFIYPNEKTMLQLGNSFTLGDRLGGDVTYIKHGADSSIHQYYEENNTWRNVSTFQLERKLKKKNKLVLKQSAAIFNRDIAIPNYRFSGINYNSFTDASYLSERKKHTIIGGINLVYDLFDENASANGLNRDNTNYTGGLYLQDTWDATEKIKVETGLRVDVANYQNALINNTEVFVLPRISFLFKFTEKLSSRIGGGLGYKTPTLFTEETESMHYQRIAQLNNVTSERSYGGTADINFKTPLGDNFYFSINQMFFYTGIGNPLILTSDSAGIIYSFVNAGKPVESMGFETNAKLIYKEYLKLFAGYTFTDARAHYQAGQQFLLLVPKNKVNLALIYENPKVIKAGIEGYYTDSQLLSNSRVSPAYWEFGAMVEKSFGKIAVYLNAENFTDTRQSKYKQVANEPHSNPSFDEIWTHTEGFVFSGGLKIKL